MLELTIMTPGEYAEKEAGTEAKLCFTKTDHITDAVKAAFDKYFMRDVEIDESLPNGAEIPELLSDPVYAEYIGQFVGSEVDDSPLTIGEDGYTLKCNSYICPANTVYPDVLLGFVILAQDKYDYCIVTDTFNERTLRFLAEQEKHYRVVLSAFSDFLPSLSARFSDLSDKITINGRPLSDEVVMEIISGRQQLVDEAFQNSLESSILKPQPLLTDVNLRMTSAEFIKHCSGKSELNFNYDIILHDNRIERTWYTSYTTAILAPNTNGRANDYDYLSSYPDFLDISDIVQIIFDRASEKAENETCYAVWYPTKAFSNCFKTDLSEAISLIAVVNKEQKTIDLYNGANSFGTEKLYKAMKGGSGSITAII